MYFDCRFFADVDEEDCRRECIGEIDERAAVLGLARATICWGGEVSWGSTDIMTTLL